jgi:hypothetical protein
MPLLEKNAISVTYGNPFSIRHDPALPVFHIASGNCIDRPSHRNSLDILSVFVRGPQQIRVPASARTRQLSRLEQNPPKSEPYIPLNIRLLEMRLKVRIGRIVRHRRRNMQHVVVVAFLKDLVKDAFGCVVGDLDKVDLRSVPFGVYGHKVGAGFLGAHAACDGVAGFEGLVDHGCADEAIGACDEDVRHGGKLTVRCAAGGLFGRGWRMETVCMRLERGLFKFAKKMDGNCWDLKEMGLRTTRGLFISCSLDRHQDLASRSPCLPDAQLQRLGRLLVSHAGSVFT